MDCSNDYLMYTTEKSKKFLLATLTLIVTVGVGFEYAMGDTPAGMDLTEFVAPKKKPVLAQWMHGVKLCSKSTFTIVSDRLKSGTKPTEILNSLHESGSYNTEARLFDDKHIRNLLRRLMLRIVAMARQEGCLCRVADAVRATSCP